MILRWVLENCSGNESALRVLRVRRFWKEAELRDANERDDRDGVGDRYNIGNYLSFVRRFEELRRSRTSLTPRIVTTSAMPKNTSAAMPKTTSQKSAPDVMVAPDM